VECAFQRCAFFYERKLWVRAHLGGCKNILIVHLEVGPRTIERLGQGRSLSFSDEMCPFKDHNSLFKHPIGARGLRYVLMTRVIMKWIHLNHSIINIEGQILNDGNMLTIGV
jgi:hypothetical protein